MHDVESRLSTRMPPLMVLGLTGPVGSGCTTLSRILDSPDGAHRHTGTSLTKALTSVPWIKLRPGGATSVDWDYLNGQVDELYAQRAIGLSAAETEDASKTHQQSVAKKRLEGLLELRESAKALYRLGLYHHRGVHLFRTLSVSDLIVFRAIMAIEKPDFDLGGVADATKGAKYERFVAVARDHMQARTPQEALTQLGFSGYGDFYKECYDEVDAQRLESLGHGMNTIHRVARVVKREYWKRHYLDYSEVLQDFGDNIRYCDDPFGRRKANPRDCAYRLAKGIAQMIYLLWRTRQAAFFVIDCLRNPYEVNYLRREFANFFLLSLFATEKTREHRVMSDARASMQRLLKRDLTSSEEHQIAGTFEAADHRDAGKGLSESEILYRQNVTRCCQISDIAVNNDTEWPPTDPTANDDFLRKSLRVLCLALAPGCTKPDDDEMFMNLAYTMAMKSNCISRQVGAVIVGPDGYVVGAGWNDVGSGRISCGLRAIRDLGVEEFKPIGDAIRKDGESCESLIERLCQRVGNPSRAKLAAQLCFCLKDTLAEREAIPAERRRLMRALGVDDEQVRVGLIVPVKDYLDRALERQIEEEPPHQLEYCLALHAEENAILQGAKIGGMGVKGGTMYVTCQPCSLCAKKIQQVGLKRVIYTEAYPKSRPEIYMAGIDLQQFEGVKPRAYMRLFMPDHDEKESQGLEKENLVPQV